MISQGKPPNYLDRGDQTSIKLPSLIEVHVRNFYWDHNWSSHSCTIGSTYSTFNRRCDLRPTMQRYLSGSRLLAPLVYNCLCRSAEHEDICSLRQQAQNDN